MKNINNSDMELEEVDFQYQVYPGEADYNETLDKINNEFTRINERLLITCQALDELEINQVEMRDSIKAQIRSVTESLEDIRNKSTRSRISIYKEFESRVKSIENSQKRAARNQKVMFAITVAVILLSLVPQFL